MTEFLTKTVKYLTEQIVRLQRQQNDLKNEIGRRNETIQFKNISGELFVEATTPSGKTTQSLGQINEILNKPISVTSAHIDDSNLIFEFSDGRSLDLGAIKGQDGVSIEDVYLDGRNLMVEMSSGKVIDVGMIVGKPGTPGNDGLSIKEALISGKDLILKMTDNTYVNVGKVVGDNGEPGKSFEFPVEEFNATKQLVSEAIAQIEDIKTNADDKKLASQLKRLEDEVAVTKRLLMSKSGLGGAGGGFDGGKVKRFIGFKTSVATSVDGILTIDCKKSNIFKVNLHENINTIEFKRWPTTGYSERVTIYFDQDDVGNRTVSGWPASIRWPDGQVPEGSVAANSIDCYVFDSFDAGETIFGNIVGQNYS